MAAKIHPSKILVPVLILILGLVLVGIKAYSSSRQNNTDSELSPIATTQPTPPATQSATNTTPTLSQTPTPTPTLTTAQWNAKYGPCASLPILMYHHIQPEDIAKSKGQTGLTVTPTFLASQVDYLLQHNYHVIPIQNLVNFFNNGTSLPSKPIILTFDDGYQDFYDYAYPILKSKNVFGTLFVPTGLMENNDYLSWKEINDMNQSGVVYMGNHTWSHHSTIGSLDTISKEISTAEQQLNERGMDQQKIFAYPYGSDSAVAEKYLGSNGYQLAVTTKSGRMQCAKLRFSLPRIRVGNIQLSAYGL